MKFGHVVALCKGWYKYRSNMLHLFWMDMAHAINADGWTMQTRNDVARWCLNRLDEMREDKSLANYSNQFRLSYIFDKVHDHIRYASWYDKREMTEDDAIIWMFRDIVMGIEGKYFDEWVKPDARVLPLALNDAYYDDGKYNVDHKPVFHFAEMMCDYEAKIKEHFPNAKDWEPFYSGDSYDWTESFIHKDSWKDVQIELGEDNLNDCIEAVVFAKELKDHVIELQDGSTALLILGKFENCKDLKECKSPEKRYDARIKVTKDSFGYYEYALKSLKEYIE